MSEQSSEQNTNNLNPTAAGANETSTDQAFLNQLRQSIDAVDSEIHTLINDRAKLAQQVATVKKEHVAKNEVAAEQNPIFLSSRT